MKTITLILATLMLGSSAPLIGESPAVAIEQTENREVLGRDAMAEVRKGYEEGRFDAFLKEMDASYEGMMQQNNLSGLASLRGGGSEEGEVLAAIRPLQEERNRQLQEAVKDQTTPFAEKVRSVAAALPTAKQEAALARIAHFRQMAPGTAKTSDENALIALDLEYEYKAIHLDMPLVDGGKAVPERREKHYALQMEKADKMLAAAQTFADDSLKQDVALFVQNLDQRMAANWDQMDLTHFAKLHAKSMDPTQEKVVLILQKHQENVNDVLSEIAKR